MPNGTSDNIFQLIENLDQKSLKPSSKCKDFDLAVDKVTCSNPGWARSRRLWQVEIYEYLLYIHLLLLKDSFVLDNIIMDAMNF